MKMTKRIRTLLLSVMMIFLLLPAQASAQGLIDMERDVTLTISWQDNGTPITGAQFDLYLIATADESGELTVTGKE